MCTENSVVGAISVSPETMILAVGETGTIKATISPDNATNKKVNWTSSNPEIAIVDDKGNITAMAPVCVWQNKNTAKGVRTFSWTD